MDLELKGKVAVITGGSVGIGLAVAEALAAEGVNLVLVARQSERLKQEAARIAEGFGVRAIGVAADVAKAEEIDAVASAVEREFGGTDLLINNAGTDWIKTAKQLTADKGGDWESHLASVAREHAPIERFGTPEELASFFVFLCSKRASYSVGSTYFVDGGMLKVI